MWLYLGWVKRCAINARQEKLCPRSPALSAELRQQPPFSDYKIGDLSQKHVRLPLFLSWVPTYSMIFYKTLNRHQCTDFNCLPLNVESHWVAGRQRQTRLDISFCLLLFLPSSFSFCFCSLPLFLSVSNITTFQMFPPPFERFLLWGFCVSFFLLSTPNLGEFSA